MADQFHPAKCPACGEDHYIVSGTDQWRFVHKCDDQAATVRIEGPTERSVIAMWNFLAGEAKGGREES